MSELRFGFRGNFLGKGRAELSSVEEPKAEKAGHPMLQLCLLSLSLFLPRASQQQLCRVPFFSGGLGSVYFGKLAEWLTSMLIVEAQFYVAGKSLDFSAQ